MKARRELPQSIQVHQWRFLCSLRVWYFQFGQVGGLLKRVLYFFGNGPSLGQKSPILHLPYKSKLLLVISFECLCTSFSFINSENFCVFQVKPQVQKGVMYCKVQLCFIYYKISSIIQKSTQTLETFAYLLENNKPVLLLKT